VPRGITCEQSNTADQDQVPAVLPLDEPHIHPGHRLDRVDARGRPHSIRSGRMLVMSPSPMEDDLEARRVEQVHIFFRLGEEELA